MAFAIPCEISGIKPELDTRTELSYRARLSGRDHYGRIRFVVVFDVYNDVISFGDESL